MHRKWWSLLIPALCLVIPLDKVQANTSTPDNDLNDKLLKGKVNTKYFYSFNALKTGSHFFYAIHSSHASHSSHQSHSSHISGSNSYSTQDYSSPSAVQNNQKRIPLSIDEPAVILEDVNVRSLASVQSEALCVAKKNQIVKVMDYNTEWAKISFMNGNNVVTGWIKTNYLSKF
jgi:hypothetical protein